MEAAGEEKVSMVDPALKHVHGTILNSIVRCADWLSNGMMVMGISNHILVRYEAYSIGGKFMPGTINLSKAKKGH